MNTQEQVLKNNIMMRVRFVYGMKALPRVFLPKIALLSAMLATGGFFVSLPNVLKNMPSLLEMPKFLTFASSAFLNTRFAVQIVAVGSIIVLFYMLRDIVNTLRGHSPALVTA